MSYREKFVKCLSGSHTLVVHVVIFNYQGKLVDLVKCLINGIKGSLYIRICWIVWCCWIICVQIKAIYANYDFVEYPWKSIVVVCYLDHSDRASKYFLYLTSVMSKMPQKLPITHNNSSKYSHPTGVVNLVYEQNLSIPTSYFQVLFHHQRTDACYFQAPFYLVGSAVTKEAPTK